MSTKATIASVAIGEAQVFLEEEMLDGTAWLIIPHPLVNAEMIADERGAFIRLQLGPNTIEMIVEAHRDRRFPHQRGGEP